MAKKDKIYGRYWMCDIKKRKPCPTPTEITEATKLIGKKKSFTTQVLQIRNTDFPKDIRPEKNIYFVAVTPPHAPRDLVIEDVVEAYRSIPDWEAGEWVETDDPEDPIVKYQYLEAEE